MQPQCQGIRRIAREEGALHLTHHVCSGEDVALDGITRTDDAPRPRQAVLTRETRGATASVDDPGLPLRAAIVGQDKRLKGFMCGAPLGEQRESVGKVAQIGEGLRGDGTEWGAHSRNYRTRGEELARDCHTPALPVSAASDDGEGHGAE